MNASRMKFLAKLAWRYPLVSRLPQTSDGQGMFLAGAASTAAFAIAMAKFGVLGAAWGNFCKCLTRAYALGPERAKSVLEAMSLEEATPEAAASRKSPRC